MVDVPEWKIEKIVQILHAYPNGLSRKDLLRKCGYRSMTSLQDPLKLLQQQGRVRYTPLGASAGQQRVYLVRNQEEAS